MVLSVANQDGKPILLEMVRVIQENKDYLSDIDGIIGDGDHGVNMDKGFRIFKKRFLEQDIRLTEGLGKLGLVLMNEIGGSMGPIYGTIFLGMAEKGDDLEVICLEEFFLMVQNGLNKLQEIIDADVGDKTLMDTLIPTVAALQNAVSENQSFREALDRMVTAAEIGRDSTKNLAAKYGRSSRLGERSKGVIDAGAASCCLIFTAMANGIKKLL